ncbi:cation-transporting P-type ATPase [Aeromicrobium sp.]|nr:cation-transporting P-type ATPase [Candidatus Saccharibacteria bacterium]
MGNSIRPNFYRLSPTDVLKEVTSTAKGLSATAAKERLERLGPNMLEQVHRDSTLTTFLRQFKNLLVIILLVSAGISIYLGDGKTAAIMVLIALVNTMVGFFQEHKAETLFASLQQLMVPKAKVIRASRLMEVDAIQLVVGDVVYIEEGDSVPADLRILDEEELATNDFALTGESQPSRKFVHAISGEVALGSRHNLVFMGTTVAIGHGHGVVIGTGMGTELGRIASLSQVVGTDTSPLQKEMNNLAKRLVQGTVILAVILTLVALKAKFGVHDALLFAIGIAAAMIPNGLAAEVNITLAQTAGRMAKARALVKKLSAVETLGATNIILTDKTGTLTKNEMTVTSLLIGKTEYKVSGTGYEAIGEVQTGKGRTLNQKELSEIRLFFETAAMASNARVNPPDDEHAVWYVVGDPTEGALITLARKAGIDPNQLDELNHEIKEFQFDSARKLMTSVRQMPDGKIVAFAKGAPESILARSTHIYDHSFERKLTTADRKRLAEYNDELASQAMRNLAFGYRVLPPGSNISSTNMNQIESNFIYLGMVSMLDPLREQVPNAMIAARKAHVKVSVVTGDNPTTAQAIARHAELADNPDDITVVLGTELANLADNQILKLVERGGTVFSRVAPEDKLRIVEIAKASGRVVAVTGDGINDAPALKRADIGVAMGKTGTDVAKDAAEIILLDDSFSTLIGAIEQGRLTYRNIHKAARCALTDNAGELFVILISLVAQAVFDIPLAITAIQILAIDIAAEMFPITALGWDKAQRNLMHDKPRKLQDHIINKSAVLEFVSFGLLSASLAYANFLFFFERRGLSPVKIDTTSQLYFQATILTYLTIVLCQFVNLFLVRSDSHEKVFTSYLWSNKKLLIAFAISFVLIANIIYNPWVSPYFHAAALSVTDVLTAVVVAFIYCLIRLSQRHTRMHTRSKLFQDHDHQTLSKHPKLA